MPLKRINLLDSIRFFALSIIVLSHMEFLEHSSFGEIYKLYLHNPTLGVDYFFLLSGFGLFYSNYGKNLSTQNSFISIKFSIKKIKKIYFLYVISLCVSLLHLLFLSPIQDPFIAYKFILNLTLLQSISASNHISHGINAVCWFLSTLFICYMFFPVLNLFIRKKCLGIKHSIVIYFSTIFFIEFLSVFFIKIQSIYPFFNDFYYGSPYIRVFYVFLGMQIANFYLQKQDLKISSKTELLIISLLICYFFSRNMIYNLLCNNGVLIRLIDLIMVSSIFLMVWGNGFISKSLNRNTFLIKWGGTYGMYIFLLHYPIRMIVTKTFDYFAFYPKTELFLFESFLIILLTIASSVFVKKLLESNKNFCSSKKVKS